MRQPFEVKYIPCHKQWRLLMSVRCVERDLWEICGMLFFWFQRGRAEVMEEIKEARWEGGTQSGGSHICVRDPSFLNMFSPDNLEGKRGRQVFFGRKFY